MTDVVTSSKQAQKILRSVNVARRVEDPIDKVIIERIVNEKDSGARRATEVMPRAMDIMDFMEGI